MKESENLILIEKAICLERRRHDDYKKMSRKVKNIEAKEVLIKLSNVEKKHLILLKSQLKSLKRYSKINLDLLVNNEINLVGKELNFKKVISSISSDLDIIRNAIKLEESDPPFYGSIILKTKDKDLKKVFHFLKKEEENHLRVLKLKLKDLQVLSSKLSSSKDPRALFYYIVRGK